MLLLWQQFNIYFTLRHVPLNVFILCTDIGEEAEKELLPAVRKVSKLVNVCLCVCVCAQD